VELGQKGKNINDDIAALVKLGLPLKIQQALDVVRVVGNESVHPGELNVKDDQETVQALFELINLICEDRLSEPRRIDHLYRTLPKAKLDQIANRDS
jgi:hypothetical protein